MDGQEPRRLGLELRFDTQPIEGRLYDQSGQGRLDRSFSGWLGLISAIDAARGPSPSQQSEQKEDTP